MMMKVAMNCLKLNVAATRPDDTKDRNSRAADLTVARRELQRQSRRGITGEEFYGVQEKNSSSRNFLESAGEQLAIREISRPAKSVPK